MSQPWPILPPAPVSAPGARLQGEAPDSAQPQSALGPVQTVTRVLARTTSDTFSTVSADLNGRISDAVLGGVGKAWTADAGALQVTGGHLARGATNPSVWIGVLTEPAPDVEMSWVIASIPSANLYFDIHRAATSGSPNTYRCQLNVGGGGMTAQITRRVSGVTTNLSIPFPVVAGDRLALRYVKGMIELRQNGILQVSVADMSIPAAGYCGVTGTAANTIPISGVTVDAIT